MRRIRRNIDGDLSLSLSLSFYFVLDNTRVLECGGFLGERGLKPSEAKQTSGAGIWWMTGGRQNLGYGGGGGFGGRLRCVWILSGESKHPAGRKRTVAWQG